ncbi:MAG: hypothetical protein ABJB47_18075, partial [Actinomycetota bacterium]
MTSDDHTPAHGPADPQPGHPQSSHPQAGYSQAGYPGAGYPHAGYSQAGYPQAGYAPPGYPEPGHPAASQQLRSRRHHRVLAGVAAVAFAIGAGGTALATGAASLPLGGARVMSTASIVQKADPAVVDIVSRLGEQGAVAAGTGIVLSSNGEILTN